MNPQDPVPDDHIYTMLTEVRRDVKAIRKVLFGNGELGMQGRIQRLEDWREVSVGQDRRRGSRTWEVVVMVLSALVGGAVAILGSVIISGGIL